MLNYQTRHSLNRSPGSVSPGRDMGGIWLHGAEVTLEEVEQVVERHGLDGNIVQDIFDKNELPRIEYDESKNIYMFLRIAWRSKSKEIRTAPLLAVACGDDYITLSQTKSPQSSELAQLNSKNKDTVMSLLYTFASVIDNYEQLVHATADSVRNIKYRLRRHEATNEDFLQFITIEENLATYLYNLTAMLSMAERFREDKHSKLSLDHIEALEDVMLHIKQLKANVNSSVSAVSSIQNVYSTVSNNTLNQRMKLLTVVTLLVTVPNVFYGMYGMNVALPMAKEPWAYGAIVGFTVILMLILAIIVRRSKLL
ncbi:hypothetical protein GX865_02765 [Candidatus Saccharibacteria bacterium]|jgi:magnesium transporter|nr:hypothetical protein [Candidatus Saccharibacteria bacterium]